MEYCYTFLITIILFLSPSIKASDKIEVLPNDTVYFDYSSTKEKIFFKGLINDSIEVKIFFDTGLPIDEFIVSDSLKNHLSETNSVRLWYSNNNYAQSLFPKIYPNSSHIFKEYGLNTISVGWEYFLDQVIQISYKKEYIVITDNIDSIPDIQTYDSIHFKIGKIFPYILIPVKIDIQGNIIERDAIIDTGANVSLVIKSSLLDNYNVDYKNAFIGISRSGGKGEKSKEIQLIANSISVKNCSIKDTYISYNPSLEYFDSPILIGNRFWQEHSVILDLQNFVLYLKEDRK